MAGCSLLVEENIHRSTIGIPNSKQEKCMINCVQRFMDASKMFTQQYAAQKAQYQKPSEEFGSKLYT